ncbi:hypothetical protein ACCO45_013949 [Purpureocillium lilacinum]|uniref:Uncharacterized protein n=1 Tax=Purpureocillium lilacinum TaxID=33203 RepID=A0ACC4D8T3_PURLI
MKTILALLVSALQLGTTSSSPISNATELCGALGVMKLDMATLPEGVDPGAIRACAEHPLALSSSPIQKRRCWRGQKGGCSHGYCYRRCGEGGEWCWTARNRGVGAWISCKSDDECRGEEACAAALVHRVGVAVSWLIVGRAQSLCKSARRTCRRPSMNVRYMFWENRPSLLL